MDGAAGDGGGRMWAAVAACPPTVVLATLRPYARGERHPAIRAASLHVLLPLSGRGLALVGGQAHALAPGSVVVVPWAVPLALEADPADPWVLASLHLAPWPDDRADPPEVLHAWAERPGEAELPAAPAGPLPPLAAGLHPAPPHLGDLAREAVWAWNDRAADPGLRRLRLRAAALATATALAAPLPVPDSRLARLLGWLRVYSGRPITRAEMCRRSGLSSTALGRAFLAATGRSPMAYLIDLRLARARELVLGTDRPLAAIAEEVGIPDPTHFARLFRRRYGQAPSALRSVRSSD